jgi:protein SCO1
MKNIVRTGILLLILAIPVFLYLFLQGFGRNQYAIPVFYESGVISTLKNCEFGEGQHVIPSFSFVSHSGDLVTEKVLENNITVVDFFFTRCPSICPVMSSQLARVQDAFAGDEGVKILSFSVDPEYDSVKVLEEYARQYKADDQHWYFITGEKEKIYHLARCGFVLPVEDGDGSPEDFIHSEKFILVDKNRRIRGYYDGTDREEVDRLIVEMKILKEFED